MSVPAASRKVAAIVVMGSFDLLRQLFGLMFLVQGTDELIEIAVHDIVQFIEREVDAVVGYPSLRKIIRANALGAIARADLKLARLRLLTLLLFSLLGQQPSFEQRQCARAVLMLRALVLALDHDTGRQMGD